MKCSACEGTELQPLLSLGHVPPVNDFIEAKDLPLEKGFPLDLFFCSHCSLVQLGERVPPTSLFSHYRHTSAASKANVNHLADVTRLVKERHGGHLSGAKVLEIGSNDGTLLDMFKKEQAAVLGVDPAKNLCQIVADQGLDVVNDFFTAELGLKLTHDRGTFDWIVALNVVAHTPDFISLLKGVVATMHRGSQFMLENAYVVETILKGQFDTIYHEHVYCFSLTALNYAFEKVGMKVTDVEVIPTQGGSIRVFGALASSSVPVSPRVQELMALEREKGFLDVTSYAQVGQKVADFKRRLREKIIELNKKFGNKTIALGASARGVVILNYCNLTTNEVALVIDDTVLKQGRLVPGMHIPVRGWGALEGVKDEPRAYLLLAWNYRRDMIDRLQKQMKHGTVVVPFPDFVEVELATG